MNFIILPLLFDNINIIEIATRKKKTNKSIFVVHTTNCGNIFFAIIARVAQRNEFRNIIETAETAESVGAYKIARNSW